MHLYQLRMKDFTIIRALILNATLRAVMLLGREGGGSTLTQQLAKALLDHERKSKAIRVNSKIERMDHCC